MGYMEKMLKGTAVLTCGILRCLEGVEALWQDDCQGCACQQARAESS